MYVEIIAVGIVKESFFKEAIAEYTRRLQPYTKLEIREIAEEKLPQNASPAQARAGREKEGARILAAWPKRGPVWALCIEGKQRDSLTFAEEIGRATTKGISHLTFLIGGSTGLSDAVKAKSDVQLSFSKMTFPHHLMRVILLEQIYRAFRILHHEPYHK